MDAGPNMGYINAVCLGQGLEPPHLASIANLGTKSVASLDLDLDKVPGEKVPKTFPSI